MRLLLLLLFFCSNTAWKNPNPKSNPLVEGFGTIVWTLSKGSIVDDDDMDFVDHFLLVIKFCVCPGVFQFSTDLRWHEIRVQLIHFLVGFFPESSINNHSSIGISLSFSLQKIKTSLSAIPMISSDSISFQASSSSDGRVPHDRYVVFFSVVKDPTDQFVFGIAHFFFEKFFHTKLGHVESYGDLPFFWCLKSATIFV